MATAGANMGCREAGGSGFGSGGGVGGMLPPWLYRMLRSGSGEYSARANIG